MRYCKYCQWLSDNDYDTICSRCRHKMILVENDNRETKPDYPATNDYQQFFTAKILPNNININMP